MSSNSTTSLDSKLTNGINNSTLNPSILSCIPHLIGNDVIIEVQNKTEDNKITNDRYKGFFNACSDEFDVSLSSVQKYPMDEDDKYCISAANTKPFMTFKSENIICISGEFNLKEDPVFATDSDIAASKFFQNDETTIDEKEFQVWESEGNEAEEVDFSCADGESTKKGWAVEDMFKANNGLGVESSFVNDSPQYSTAVVPNDINEEERKRADKIAKEIESNQASKHWQKLENDDEERDLGSKTEFENEQQKRSSPDTAAAAGKKDDDDFESVPSSKRASAKYIQKSNSNTATSGVYSQNHPNPNRNSNNKFNRKYSEDNSGGGSTNCQNRNNANRFMQSNNERRNYSDKGLQGGRGSHSTDTRVATGGGASGHPSSSSFHHSTTTATNYNINSGGGSNGGGGNSTFRSSTNNHSSSYHHHNNHHHHQSTNYYNNNNNNNNNNPFNNEKSFGGGQTNRFSGGNGGPTRIGSYGGSCGDYPHHGHSNRPPNSNTNSMDMPNRTNQHFQKNNNYNTYNGPRRPIHSASENHTPNQQYLSDAQHIRNKQHNSDNINSASTNGDLQHQQKTYPPPTTAANSVTAGAPEAVAIPTTATVTVTQQLPESKNQRSKQSFGSPSEASPTKTENIGQQNSEPVSIALTLESPTKTKTASEVVPSANNNNSNNAVTILNDNVSPGSKEDLKREKSPRSKTQSDFSDEIDNVAKKSESETASFDETEAAKEKIFKFNRNAAPFIPKSKDLGTVIAANISAPPAPIVEHQQQQSTQNILTNQQIVQSYSGVPIQMGPSPGIISAQMSHVLPQANLPYSGAFLNYPTNFIQNSAAAAAAFGAIPSVYPYSNPVSVHSATAPIQIPPMIQQQQQQPAQTQQFILAQTINAANQAQHRTTGSRTGTPNGNGLQAIISHDGSVTHHHSMMPPSSNTIVTTGATAMAAANPIISMNSLPPPPPDPQSAPPSGFQSGIPIAQAAAAQQSMLVSIPPGTLVSAGGSIAHPPLYQQYVPSHQHLARNPPSIQPQQQQQSIPTVGIPQSVAPGAAGGVYIATAPHIYQQQLMNSQYQVPYYYHQQGAASLQQGAATTANIAPPTIPPPSIQPVPAQHFIQAAPSGLIGRPVFYPPNPPNMNGGNR